MNQLFGGLLFGVGILIMTCSGLCSLIFLVGSIGGPTLIMEIVFLGGIPFAIGFGLFRWGRWLLRRDRDENI